jgi:pimeloyl-ACP methyl ester carboxylesterase
MDAYVAVIEDGFDEFGIGRDSVLMGNGFGGTVALACTRTPGAHIQTRN